MSERRRVSLTDKAEGFEPAEVDLWENETWGGLFLTVDVTKPVQDKLTELRAEATDAAEAIDPENPDATEVVDEAVKLIAKLYGAVLVPAPGHGRKKADVVVQRAYAEGKVGLGTLRDGFQEIIAASRPT